MGQTVKNQFEKYFTEEHLKSIYFDRIVYSNATGIDNISPYSFLKQLNDQISILSRKVLAGTYNFTKYKLKLINKGRNKVPREISIPTVRDRIALRALCDFLAERYQDNVLFQLPQKIIGQVKDDVSLNLYDGCIKLDVANFYPSLDHNILRSRLHRKIRTPQIIDLIFLAVTSPTVSVSRVSDQRNTVGVPQGLSISNILAAIYLGNIDKYMYEYPNIKYHRYVDDILIFCRFKDAQTIAKEVIKRFSNKVRLKIHDPIKTPEKSIVCKLDTGFEYLGYRFSDSLVTARSSSIEKLKSSLAAIFTSYKHSRNKNDQFLLWRLNLRITGCIFENKSKGWLFFFSAMNDEHLLHLLDHYVKKLCIRFGVSVKPKKFVRAFKELSFNKYNTKYIPNFDSYNLDQMKFVLKTYFSFNLTNMNDDSIIYHFKKKVSQQVRDLLTDVQDFKY